MICCFFNGMKAAFGGFHDFIYFKD